METRLEFTVIPNFENAPKYNYFAMIEEVNSKVESLIKDEIALMEEKYSGALEDNDQITIRIIMDKPDDFYKKQNYKNFDFEEISEIIFLYLNSREKAFTMDVHIQIKDKL